MRIVVPVVCGFVLLVVLVGTALARGMPQALVPTATPTELPSPTASMTLTPLPTQTPSPTLVPTPTPTLTPSPTQTPTLVPTPTFEPTPIIVNGKTYTAYIDAASKPKQVYQYSCEFDAAWVIFKTFGLDVSLDQMVQTIGVDERVEPYYIETEKGFVIYGGDITARYSGDYTANFLARSTGSAMKPVFEQFGLHATAVNDRAGVEAALRSGALVWMKTTVDFKDWRPATWITPEHAELPTVLGNDHAVVVIGFNQDHVVIRDVLGPTSSNRQRPYEYEVSWARFLYVWEAQGFDGLAVKKPT